MNEFLPVGMMLQRARIEAGLSQSELAAASGTTQSAIARLEQAQSNPTVATLVRSAAAAGCRVEIALVPSLAPDAVIERYKRDIDRTLLRENLRLSHDQRVRSLGEWQVALHSVTHATTGAVAKPRRRK